MDVEMNIIHCSECGMPFGVTEDRVERLRECHNTFYCPSGHSQFFPQKTKAEMLQDKIFSKNREIDKLKNKILKRQKKKMIK
jgi:hypothetical protein